MSANNSKMKNAKECLEISNSKIEPLKKEFIEFLEYKILEESNNGCYKYYVPFCFNQETFKKYLIISKDIREQYYKKHFEDLGFKVLEDGVISWKEVDKNCEIDQTKIISECEEFPCETKESFKSKIKKFICRFCQHL